MKTNQLPITLDEILKNKSNYEIIIWEDEECRDQGLAEHFSLDDCDDITNRDLEDYDSIEHLIESIYEDNEWSWTGKSIMGADGSIELEELDNNGEWKRTLFHISPDSSYKLKNYQVVPNRWANTADHE